MSQILVNAKKRLSVAHKNIPYLVEQNCKGSLGYSVTVIKSSLLTEQFFRSWNAAFMSDFVIQPVDSAPVLQKP